MEITIMIPSRGRADWKYMDTIRSIVEDSTFTAALVVPESEYTDYCNMVYNEQRLVERIQVRATPSEIKGIGPTRQWILENCPTQGCVMLDDDMKFYRREDEDDWHLRYPKDIGISLDGLFQRMEELLEEYAHGGLSARQGNNRVEENLVENTRVNNVHFFDRDVFLGEECRFDALPVMEDFYVTLTLLTRGYYNCVIYDWAWGQRSSGMEGGCSIYRDKEVQAQGANGLKAAFPEFVTVRDAYSKSGNSAFAGWRKDVTVQWKKAFCTAVNERKLKDV